MVVTKGEDGSFEISHQYEYGNLYKAAKGRERFEEVEKFLHLDFPLNDLRIISRTQDQLQENLRLEQLRELEAKVVADRQARDRAAREEASNARERARQQVERQGHIGDSWGTSSVPSDRSHQTPRTEISREFPPNTTRPEAPRTEEPGSHESSQPSGQGPTIGRL
jgi:hypothetical protein